MKQNVLRSQDGFTLIEIIAVLIIIGVLAAVAAPRFVNLQAEAEEAALQGQASNLSSGSALNFGACALGKTGDCETVTGCTVEDAKKLVVDFDDSKFHIAASVSEVVPHGRYTLLVTTEGDDFGTSASCYVIKKPGDDDENPEG